MSDDEESQMNWARYPGVRVALAGLMVLVAAILGSVVAPQSDVPFGGVELLALAGAGLVLFGSWRAAMQFVRDEE